MSQTYLACAYALMRKEENALRMLKEFKEKEYFPAALIAILTTALGHKEETFEWLNKAYKERDGILLTLNAFHFWDPIRDDPRFQELLRRMKFPQLPHNSGDQ